MEQFNWIVLGSAVFVIVSLLGSFTFVVFVYIFIFGFLLVVRRIFFALSEQRWLRLHQSYLSLQALSLKEVEERMRTTEINGKSDSRISGSILIDEQIQEILHYFMRDFIITWFSDISLNTDFTFQLHESIQRILTGISNQCKCTDWALYLTTKMVDDLVSHLRLYKEARIKCQNCKDGRSLVDCFFDQEAKKEKEFCRDEICLKVDCEKKFLSDLLELILYLVSPAGDYEVMPIRSVAIETLVSSVILPWVNQVTDPDYINSLIVWFSSDIPVTSELFVTVMKTSTDSAELDVLRKIVSQEINQLRSMDSGNRAEGNEVKQKLGSLEYLRQVLDTRLSKVSKGLLDNDGLELHSNFELESMSRGKLFQLPLEAIMKNSLTLDHFMNYMSSIDHMHYVNLYLNIECWRTSVTERMCALELERIHHMQNSNSESSMPGLCHDYFSAHDLVSHKEEAEVMYELYLSEKASPRVVLDSSIINKLILKLRSERINELWFDEVQQELFQKLQNEDMFLPGFRRSVWYIRLLAELDLLKEVSRSDDEESQSLDSVASDCLHMAEQDSLISLFSMTSPHNYSSSPLSPSPCHSRSPSSVSSKSFLLLANITGTEIVREGSRSHAVYRVSVMKKEIVGTDEMWHVFRRYSEFYDFHSALTSTFMDLSSISFPSKKMLNNLAAWFLEKRMHELNSWLDKLLEPPTMHSHPGLQELVLRFLEHSSYHTSPPNLAKRVEDNLVAPIRTGVKSVSNAVRAVPDSVISTVDGVVDGIYKKLVKPQPTHVKADYDDGVSLQKSSLDLEGDENLPLRIVLLLFDEIFDLRSKDQWFRRRIVLFLRQIMKAMFGSLVNKKIVEGVSYITSPNQVATCIELLKESIWPKGILSISKVERTQEEIIRARLSAKVTMLTSISDEFKAILGSQTTSRGILSIYECLQYQGLNKRLLYVLIEGTLEFLFPNNKKSQKLLKSFSGHSKRFGVKSHSRNPSRLLPN